MRCEMGKWYTEWYSQRVKKQNTAIVIAVLPFPMWWSDGDSNPGPSACKADALPTELPPQNSYEF